MELFTGIVRSAPMPVVIVDTNIVVAGLPLDDNPLPVARILRGMRSAAFPYAVSAALLDEYRDVLARPNVRRLHGLPTEGVAALLGELERHALRLEPAPEAPPAPDPGDQMLWALLAGHAELRLVTGDKALLRDRRMRGRVVSAEAFLAEGR